MAEPLQSLPNPFNQLAVNLGLQGEAFNKPLSVSNQYYAFLSKADKDWETGLWDILFEVVPAEWAANALGRSSEEVDIVAPEGPDSLWFGQRCDRSPHYRVIPHDGLIIRVAKLSRLKRF